MKTIIKRLQCFVFALVFIFTFVFNCYLDSKVNNVYAVETVMYYAYEVVLTLLAELGICVTDVDYAYTGEKVARDKKQLVNKVKSSFDTFMKSTKANYIFLEKGYETLWEHRFDIADEFGALLSSASCKTFTLSRELSQALVIWAEQIRGRLANRENLDVVCNTVQLSDEDWDVVMNGGSLSVATIISLCSIPSYMIQDVSQCKFNSIVNTDKEVSIYRITYDNAESYLFYIHYFGYYSNGKKYYTDCDLILNNTDLYTENALIFYKKNAPGYYRPSDEYANALAYPLSIYKKGYFEDAEDFEYKYYDSAMTYMAKTDIPDLVWNSKVGIRENEGYVSAKAIPDSALADVYVTPELVDVISKPHDLSKLKDLTISQILEMLREGTITYEQAMELIKAITDTDAVADADAEVKDDVSDTEKVEDRNDLELPPFDTNFNGKFDFLKTKFPFCIPFDIVSLFKGVSQDEIPPKFHFEYKFKPINYTFVIDIDLVEYEKYIAIFRDGFYLIFLVGLMLVIGKVIKWA